MLISAMSGQHSEDSEDSYTETDVDENSTAASLRFARAAVKKRSVQPWEQAI